MANKYLYLYLILYLYLYLTSDHARFAHKRRAAAPARHIAVCQSFTFTEEKNTCVKCKETGVTEKKHLCEM